MRIKTLFGRVTFALGMLILAGYLWWDTFKPWIEDPESFSDIRASIIDTDGNGVISLGDVQRIDFDITTRTHCRFWPPSYRVLILDGKQIQNPILSAHSDNIANAYQAAIRRPIGESSGWMEFEIQRFGSGAFSIQHSAAVCDNGHQGPFEVVSFVPIDWMEGRAIE